jgi:hypothetical protein
MSNAKRRPFYGCQHLYRRRLLLVDSQGAAVETSRWHLHSRWLRKVLSHTLAVWLCQ